MPAYLQRLALCPARLDAHHGGVPFIKRPGGRAASHLHIRQREASLLHGVGIEPEHHFRKQRARAVGRREVHFSAKRFQVVLHLRGNGEEIALRIARYGALVAKQQRVALPCDCSV